MLDLWSITGGCKSVSLSVIQPRTHKMTKNIYVDKFELEVLVWTTARLFLNLNRSDKRSLQKKQTLTN